MKIWKEHYRALQRLVPMLDSMPAGERTILEAPGCLDLEFDITHRDKDGTAIVTLCQWFDHPSGDSFPDGGMEIRLDHAKKEAWPYSIQTPTFDEPGKVLPPLDKNLDDALHEWLGNLNRLNFKTKDAQMFLS